MNEARLHCCLSKLKKKKLTLLCLVCSGQGGGGCCEENKRGGGGGLMLHKRIGHNRSLSNSENTPRALGAGPA